MLEFYSRCHSSQKHHMIYQNILQTIGNTPIVKINKLGPKDTNLYVKVEAFNPMASVKDRLGLAIIEDAEQKGLLKPGQTVIEVTSGNTGVALAMVCAVKNYPFIAVMGETFSIERRKIMQALGAKVILTSADLSSSEVIKNTEELARENNWFMPKQFDNPANPAYHRNTTACEILLDFANLNLDYFVSGYGTGGTISGVGEVLKLARPNIKIIGAEPESAQMVKTNHWQRHKIQGWTPDFIPGNLNLNIIDSMLPVEDIVARDTALALAQKEGIFCGISGGATFAAALEVAKTAQPGANILAMLPDTGERYMSTFLFEGVT